MSIVKSVVPVFDTVTEVASEDVPARIDPKSNVDGLTLRMAVVPVPLSVIVAGERLVSCGVIVTVALDVVVVDGLNVT